MTTVDFHNHLMPGVDDGAETEEQASQAIAAFKVDGVSGIVTTPHVDGSLTTPPDRLAVRLAKLDASFEALQTCAEAVGGVRVERGAEILVDAPDLDLSDTRLRLAGTKSFLMEFPFGLVPPYSPK